MFLPLHDVNPIRHLRFPYVTYGLIGLNVLVFLYQLSLSPRGFDEAAVVYGLIPAVVRNVIAGPVPGFPEPVTLVTYAFLHADWLHLLSNMLFLWIFGDNIEDAMGPVKFVLFYLACAILAGLAHTLFNPDSVGPLIGASGAVAGVMGAYILLYPHARVYVLFRIVIPIPLPLPAMWMLGAWAAMQVFYAFAMPGEPVAWWAHLGGLVSGALLAVPLKRREVPLWGGR
jgi:membrane associated rhomboid family serine protease